MEQFQYQAVNVHGKRAKGLLEAEDLTTATRLLREQGLYPQYIELKRRKRPNKAGKTNEKTEPVRGSDKRIPRDSLILFCRQLGAMLNAGTDMEDALFFSAQKTKNKRLRRVLFSVQRQVAEGAALSQACTEHPHVFKPFFIQMVFAAETSDNLGDVLERVASRYEKEQIAERKTKSVFIYPLTVMVVAAVLAFGLMFTLLPQLIGTASRMGTELPLITRLVNEIRVHLTEHGLSYLSAVVCCLVVLLLLRKISRTRTVADYLALRLPLFGSVIRNGGTVQFACTFSALLNAGVPPSSEAWNVAADSVRNRTVSRKIREIFDQSREGDRLTEQFKHNRFFPPFALQLIETGERTGRLRDALGQAAVFYETEYDESVNRLKTAMNGLAALSVVITLGTLVPAVLLPTVSLYQTFNGL